MSDEIKEHIKKLREQNVSDDEIKKSLLSSGWPSEEIDKRLSSSSVPIPSYKGGTNSGFGMWIAFEYALMFIALAVSAIGLAGLGHYYVDQMFDVNRYWDERATFYSSMLVVAVPILLFFVFSLKRKYEKNPTVKDIKIRKVLVYIALVWTFLVLITRLIRTVYSFLEGDIALTPSLLHLLITLLVTGSIFVYFVIDVYKDSKT